MNAGVLRAAWEPEPEDRSDELDREFLARLLGHGRPARVRELFDGCEPRWAVDASHRCEYARLLTADKDCRLHLTPTGREQTKVGIAENLTYRTADAAMVSSRPYMRRS